MQKTIHQLNSEIYQIIQYRDTRIIKAVLAKHFPKFKGQISKLKIDELEKLVPLLREAYGNGPNP